MFSDALTYIATGQVHVINTPPEQLKAPTPIQCVVDSVTVFRLNALTNLTLCVLVTDQVIMSKLALSGSSF